MSNHIFFTPAATQTRESEHWSPSVIMLDAKLFRITGTVRQRPLSPRGIKVFIFKYANHLRLHSQSDTQVMNCGAALEYLLQQIMFQSFRK